MPVGKLNPFNPDSDDFEAWVEVVDQYLVANDIDKTKDGGKAVAVFISSIGLSTYSLLKNLLSPAEPHKQKLEDLVKILKNHFKPAPKALAERHKFYARRQKPGESVNLFLADLRRLAVTCTFENLNISLRDQFIFGLLSEAAQKRIFLEKDTIDLQTVVQIAVGQEQAEASTIAVRSGPSSSSLSLDSVYKVQHGKGRKDQTSNSCPNC